MADAWVIVKVPDSKDYKLLQGHAGSYTDGSSWQLNSGIIHVTKDSVGDPDNTEYYIHGYTGSVYKCWKSRYGLRMSIAGIATELTNMGCEILSKDEAMDVLQSFVE